MDLGPEQSLSEYIKMRFYCLVTLTFSSSPPRIALGLNAKSLCPNNRNNWTLLMLWPFDNKRAIEQGFFLHMIGLKKSLRYSESSLKQDIQEQGQIANRSKVINK